MSRVIWKVLEVQRRYYVILHHTTSYWDGLEYASWRKWVDCRRMFQKVLGSGTRKIETVERKQSLTPF